MAIADGRREGCDGCGRLVLVDRLSTVPLPGGETVRCCPDCEPHARAAARKLSSLENGRRACDGCTEPYPRSALEETSLPDGTVVSCCPDCLREVPGHSDGGADTAVGGGRARTTEIATARNLCSQCHGWVREELYHVTTTDDRTEEMCEPCKERLERRGVVAEVRMRETEAREILGVEEGATEGEIRAAFLSQIKNAHPDRKTGSRSAFKLVREAYERLS